MENLPDQARCSEHPSEPAISYCDQCYCAVCAVCAVDGHDGHLLLSLADVMANATRRLRLQLGETRRQAHTLEHLLGAIDPDAQRLRDYVLEELAVVQAEVETKRLALTHDVTARAQRMRRALDQEAELLEQELQGLSDGIAVLDVVGAGTGTVDRPAGALVQGKLPYAEFRAMTDPKLHNPVRLTDPLALQLPSAAVQAVCGMLTWTQASLDSRPQLLPAPDTLTDPTERRRVLEALARAPVEPLRVSLRAMQEKDKERDRREAAISAAQPLAALRRAADRGDPLAAATAV